VKDADRVDVAGGHRAAGRYGRSGMAHGRAERVETVAGIDLIGMARFEPAIPCSQRTLGGRRRSEESGPGRKNFHGIDNVIGEFGRQFQESGGTLRVEVNEVMEGEHSVVALARVGASRGDKTLDQPYAHVFHFRGDQVSEAWVVNYDQAKAAEFWS
jgi:uncharacterized protein